MVKETVFQEAFVHYLNYSICKYEPAVEWEIEFAATDYFISLNRRKMKGVAFQIILVIF